MYSHLVCSDISSFKNIIAKYKVKKKRIKQGEVQVFLIYSLLKATGFFFYPLSVGLVLNRCTLAATALYETYNIPIVKRYNRLFFRNINSMDSGKVSHHSIQM